jgi:hypothetical protein
MPTKISCEITDGLGFSKTVFGKERLNLLTLES